MGNGSLSSSNSKDKLETNASNIKLCKYLSLDFQYIDQEKFYSIEKRVRFLSTDTVRAVAKEFLSFDEPKSINPVDIVLVYISVGGRCITLPKNNVNMTLQELEIRNESLLCFEPLNIKKRRKSLVLFLFSPDENQRKIYEWKEHEITLKSFLNDIINIFELKSIKPEAIQLFTFTNENLNSSNNLEKKLCDLGLVDYSSVFVALKKFPYSQKYDQNIKVLIKSSLHGEVLFHASCLNSIIELEDQIRRRFPSSYNIQMELSNKKNEILENTDVKCKLQHLGVQTGDIINAFISDDNQQKQMEDVRQSTEKLKLSSSIITTIPVYVKCEFSTTKPQIIEVSATDTIDKIRTKIIKLKNIPLTTQLRLYSKSVQIDDMQSNRCLVDFGIHPGDTIHVSMIDVYPNIYSFKESQISLLSKPLNKYQSNSQPHGLVNFGNTCFMNSALQCLIHVQALTDFFLNGFLQAIEYNNHHDDDHDDHNPFDIYGEMVGAYAELIWNMRRPDLIKIASSNSFKPTRIKQVISYFAPSFATSDQQDAQEFITFLLDALHNDFKAKNKSDENTIIQQLFFGTLQSKITCLKCNRVNITINRISFLPLSINEQERLFKVIFVSKSGYQESTILNVNAKRRVGNLVQKFLDLCSRSDLFNQIIVIGTKSEEQIDFKTLLAQLSEDELTLIEQDTYMFRTECDRFDTDTDNLKLEECLQGFVSLEYLDDPWFCRQKSCYQNTVATKQLQFKSLPHVVIIQLKRFSYKNGLRQKLDTFVDYPIDGLDLNTLLTSSSLDRKQNIYDLIAVSNHMGSIHSGHYTAYARQQSNMDDWYQFDDNDVSPIYSQKSIVSRNAYLLFYMKRI